MTFQKNLSIGRSPQTLDLELLRTLGALQDLGSLERVAQHVGRTGSAVSLQLKRLETQCGRPLLRKVGRRLALTEDGESVLGYGRRILALHDDLLQKLHGTTHPLGIRLGVPQDVAERVLARVLARFGRSNPGVDLRVTVGRNAELDGMMARGDLDLAITFEPASTGSGDLIGEVPLRWLGSLESRWDGKTPLPLVMFEPPCLFRRTALEVLDRERLPWRPVFSSPSLSGLWAAVAAGLGFTVRSELGVPTGIVALPTNAMPPLPSLGLWIHGTSGPPAVEALRKTLVEVLRPAVAALATPPRRRRGVPRERSRGAWRGV
jgi:DNA-binding transcriptional LysR family regulator